MSQFKFIYFALFFLSLVFVVLYLKSYTKQHGIHYIAFGILGAFANLNYWSMAAAEMPDAFFQAALNVYASLLFVSVVVLYITCDICKVKSKVIRNVSVMLAMIVLVAIVAGRNTGFFYKTFDVDLATGEQGATYGFAYILYLVYVFGMLLFTTAILVVSRNKNKISNRSYWYVVGINGLFLISTIITRTVRRQFDFDSVAVVCIDFLMLLLCRKIPLYDVESVISETVDSTGKMGIVILDKEQKLLGYNSAVEKNMPEFTSYKIDFKIPCDSNYYEPFKRMIGAVDSTGKVHSEILENGGNYYSVVTDFLLMNGKHRGYQMIIDDVTVQQKYIKLMENFKAELETEVDRQTRQILKMQDSVLLEISELIGSRDDSTGGHVKRTSKVVEILAQELKKENIFDVSDLFFERVIKAAPLHDLGKIAVDDAILRKPGQFTPEEFEQMKNHAAKGGEIVSKVLQDLNHNEFISIATNVAHYHHEKWDGTGYPDGLAGEQIPLEARIMAVADVYDALVSKRYYKGGFDYKEARDIITGGMGTQFDPRLKDCFEKCVPALEAYYDAEDAAV